MSSPELEDAEFRPELADAIEDAAVGEDYTDFLNTVNEILDEKTLLVVEDDDRLEDLEDGMVYSVADEPGLRKVTDEGTERLLPQEQIMDMVEMEIESAIGNVEEQLSSNFSYERFYTSYRGDNDEGTDEVSGSVSTESALVTGIDLHNSSTNTSYAACEVVLHLSNGDSVKFEAGRDESEYYDTYDVHSKIDGGGYVEEIEYYGRGTRGRGGNGNGSIEVTWVSF